MPVEAQSWYPVQWMMRFEVHNDSIVIESEPNDVGTLANVDYIALLEETEYKWSFDFVFDAEKGLPEQITVNASRNSLEPGADRK